MFESINYLITIYSTFLTRFNTIVDGLNFFKKREPFRRIVKGSLYNTTIKPRQPPIPYDPTYILILS